MSFFKSIKRAMGFGPEDTEMLDDDAITDDSTEAGTQRQLFDAVLGLFNQWSPDFVSECIDTEAQRRYLYNALGRELRDAIPDPSVSTCRNGRDGDTTPDSMTEEIARLRRENGEVEALRREIEQTRLSAERQKRAMADRIQDLQDQVRNLEEKNEQITLSNIHAAKAARQEPDHVLELKAEIDSKTAELERMTTLNEQLDTKARMADTMLSELKSRLNAADKELSAMNERNDMLEKRCATLKSDNDLMTADMAKIEKLGEQLNKIEEVMARKDARIAELKSALDNSRASAVDITPDGLKALHDKISTLNAEKDALRKTIETNLYNQAHSENRLRSEIKKLRRRLGENEDDDTTPTRPRRRKRREDNTETSDSTTESLPEFGYRPPTRKQHQDDDSQMSLF